MGPQGQAGERMRAMAHTLGVELATLQSDHEFSADRMVCRYLSMKLDLTGQPERLAKFKEAAFARDIGLPWIVGARRKPDFNRLRKRLASGRLIGRVDWRGDLEPPRRFSQ